jgi:hypothetical protein
MGQADQRGEFRCRSVLAAWRGSNLAERGMGFKARGAFFEKIFFTAYIFVIDIPA